MAKGMKYGSPMKFEPSWQKIVDSNLSACDRGTLVGALSGILRPFAMFRDISDLELSLVSGTLSDDNLRDTLGIYVRFLDAIEVALNLVFNQTQDASGAAVAIQKPLETLRQLLLSLQNGDKSIWTDLTIKQRRDRSDSRIVQDLKDQAARTYKLMRRIGATADEAIGVINKVINSSRLPDGSPSMGVLTGDAIRKSHLRWICLMQRRPRKSSRSACLI